MVLIRSGKPLICRKRYWKCAKEPRVMNAPISSTYWIDLIIIPIIALSGLGIKFSEDGKLCKVEWTCEAA